MIKTIIFDGYAFAQKKEEILRQKVAKIIASKDIQPKIAAILFKEDTGSLIYTAKKHEAAQRVGISYDVHKFSMLDDVDLILQKMRELNRDEQVTGIIVQKPWRKTWENVQAEKERQQQSASREVDEDKNQARGELKNFQKWWNVLIAAIDENKDVDGLHPNTLQAVKENRWQQEGKVLPATCKAVLEILGEAKSELLKINNSHPFINDQAKTIIIGRSELLGKPLYYELLNQNKNVELIGRKEFNQRIEEKKYLLDADIVVSSTGIHQLVQAHMLKEDVVLVDVGEPQPDVDYAKVTEKAAFLTPVPGGVGPMTVVCLLENCVDMLYYQS